MSYGPNNQPKSPILVQNIDQTSEDASSVRVKFEHSNLNLDSGAHHVAPHNGTPTVMIVEEHEQEGHSPGPGKSRQNASDFSL